MASENRVQWVYASKNRDELAARYDEWAKDYDPYAIALHAEAIPQNAFSDPPTS